MSVEEGAVIVNVDCGVPPVVLNAFAEPVELEAGVITVSAPRVALLPNASFNVAVRSPEFTPAVAEVAPVSAMWSAAAALTVNAYPAGLVSEPSFDSVIDQEPAFSS